MKNQSSLILCIAYLLLNSFPAYAQVGINRDGTPPDESAGLDVNFVNKGLLLPRMTLSERNAIPDPANGLMVFCTNCGADGSLSIYSNGAWRTFSPCTVASPFAYAAVVSPGNIVWNWSTVPGAVGYKWNTSANYETAVDVGPGTSQAETGISCGTAYTRYVWAYSACGVSDFALLTVTTSAAAPATPLSGMHPASQTTIVWNWVFVDDATGFSWNTTDNFETALDLQVNTAKFEEFLTCSTDYTRYAWAYNGCGYSAPLTMTQSTSICWFCGDSLTIHHQVSGGVAPVDKTVTYGTVTNIPGAESKCWITSNLGADHQADSINDATEASAGWYWQFNRMQGYMHDGTDRTPNYYWDPFIIEWGDWYGFDPCTNELGNEWRLPTSDEWFSVVTTGGWNDWYGPWNSGLKLHAAGVLNNNGGWLDNRGNYGSCWSSTSSYSNPQFARALTISTGYVDVTEAPKSDGRSVRCIRD
ncbi:MAG: hypothetical protein NTW16_19855 [Bacteroidetes bacterium]|nr:hypothetical protein [Bacteroidota bacterium]